MRRCTKLRTKPISSPGRSLVVHVDVAHRGLGTASCGPDVLARYEIPTGKHTFAYRLSHS